MIQIATLQFARGIQQNLDRLSKTTYEDIGQSECEKRFNTNKNIEHVFRVPYVAKRCLRLLREVDGGNGNHVVNLANQFFSYLKGIVLLLFHPADVGAYSHHPA